MNENLEVMEVMEIEETYEETPIEAIETESGGGLGAALAIGAGVLAIGGAVVAAVKKHKAKKADEPKKEKPKTKLKFFVRVPVEESGEELPAEEPVPVEDENE